MGRQLLLFALQNLSFQLCSELNQMRSYLLVLLEFYRIFMLNTCLTLVAESARFVAHIGSIVEMEFVSVAAAEVSLVRLMLAVPELGVVCMGF